MGKKLTTSEFIEKSIKVHGDKYNYSLVEYKNINTKVKIICPIHGLFEQIAYHHINGCNCPSCSKVKKYTTETFITKSTKIHNNKYDYSLVNYVNNRIKVKIICPIHGVFEQNPKHHLNGVGCKLCNESKGEKKISNILNKYNISYKREKTFNNCKSNLKLLQFDFYLPDYNMCIEYDGIQHYFINERFGGKEGFIKRKKYDDIKNIFCQKMILNY